jgi:protoheme IX farnesyltransferase
MSTSTLVLAPRRAGLLARAADYVDLTRPRIVSLVLVTVTVGAYVGGWGWPSAWLLVHLLLGTALVAASAGAMNQALERAADARMPRTENRPLPTGRLRPIEAVTFGLASGAAGVAWLLTGVGLWPALLGLATWALYVGVYTPLKRLTSANTAIGAVGGALPVLMGWTAAGGQLGAESLTLFTIVYLWQFPHFMAIAWLYRAQYAAADLKMLPVVDPSGGRTARQAVLGAAAVWAASLVPAVQWISADRAPLYLVGATVLGLAQLALAVRFGRRLDETSARALLRASLVYLPALLSLLVIAPLW